MVPWKEWQRQELFNEAESTFSLCKGGDEAKLLYKTPHSLCPMECTALPRENFANGVRCTWNDSNNFKYTWMRVIRRKTTLRKTVEICLMFLYVVLLNIIICLRHLIWCLLQNRQSLFPMMNSPVCLARHKIPETAKIFLIKQTIIIYYHFI